MVLGVLSQGHTTEKAKLCLLIFVQTLYPAMNSSCCPPSIVISMVICTLSKERAAVGHALFLHLLQDVANVARMGMQYKS